MSGGWRPKLECATSRLEKEPLGVLLLAYLITLAVVRSFVIFDPTFQVWVIGLHLHHYYLGFLLVAIGSGIPLHFLQVDHDTASALLIGCGLGLVIDESGLILTGLVDYWSPLTVLAGFITSIILFILFGLQIRRRKEPVEKDAQLRLSFWRLPFTIVVFSYTIGFILTRCFTTLFPMVQLWIGDIHIQHFTLGFLLILSSGIITLIRRREHGDLMLAGIYGVGFSLIVDQLGELFTENNYWDPIVYPLFFVFLAIHSGIAVYTMQSLRRTSEGIANDISRK